jgi:hypothetical protein
LVSGFRFALEKQGAALHADRVGLSDAHEYANYPASFCDLAER